MIHRVEMRLLAHGKDLAEILNLEQGRLGNGRRLGELGHQVCTYF
jgi:hypothetical protein